jgi:hypothetical protein
MAFRNVISCQFQASATQAIYFDADALLVGASALGTNIVLSSDPAVTTAKFTAPSATAQDSNGIFGCPNGTFIAPSKIPIYAGEKWYLAASSAGSAFLYFEQPPVS